MSALLVIFAVMPNFAQDYGEVSGEQNAAEDLAETKISQQQLRDALMEMLGESTAQPAESASEGSISYDQGLIDNWQETRTSALGEKIAAWYAKRRTTPKIFPPLWANLRQRSLDTAASRHFLLLLQY